MKENGTIIDQSASEDAANKSKLTLAKAIGTDSPSSQNDKQSRINLNDTAVNQQDRRVLRSSSFSLIRSQVPESTQIHSPIGILEGSIARLWARSAPSSPNIESGSSSLIEAFKLFHPRQRNDREYYCLPSELEDSQFSSLLQPHSVDRFVYKIMRKSNAFDRRKPITPVVAATNSNDAQSAKPNNLQTNSFLSPQTTVMPTVNQLSTSNNSNLTLVSSNLDKMAGRPQPQLNILPKKFVPSASMPSMTSLPISSSTKSSPTMPVQPLVRESFPDGPNLKPTIDSTNNNNNGSGESINMIAERLRNQYHHLNGIQSNMDQQRSGHGGFQDIPALLEATSSKLSELQDSIQSLRLANSNKFDAKSDGTVSSARNSPLVDRNFNGGLLADVHSRNGALTGTKFVAEKKPEASLHRSSSAAVIRLHVDKPMMSNGIVLVSSMPSMNETLTSQPPGKIPQTNNLVSLSNGATANDNLRGNSSAPNLAAQNQSVVVSFSENSLTADNLKTYFTNADVAGTTAAAQQKQLLSSGLPPRPPITAKLSRDVGGHFKPPKPFPTGASNNIKQPSPRAAQQKPEALRRSASAIALNGQVRPLPQLKPQLSQGNMTAAAKRGTSVKKSSSAEVTSDDDESAVPSEFDRQDTQDTESSSGFVDVDEDDIIEKISDDDNLSDWSDDDSGAGSRPSSRASQRSRSRSRATGEGQQDKRARSVSIPRSPTEVDATPQLIFTDSLFPNVPPTINFVSVGQKVEKPSAAVRKLLKWRLCSITPNVVKHCLSRSHFHLSKKGSWIGYWGKHMKPEGFKDILEYQKINHFPGSFQIGRKDRLWKNLSHMQAVHGKKEYNFFPLTFVLPADLKLLKKTWDDAGSKVKKWIMKPPASARGNGIHVIHKWNQVPKKRSVIVQKYLSKPYLINDSKFDMRIYVYVTSFDPLRIYVFRDGLARFASCKYSSSLKSLSNRYMHMTNYSVNKRNPGYESNADETICQGHKWSLKALWAYMQQHDNINTADVWSKIKDLIVKTIISCESNVNSMVKAHVRNRLSVHELFGFDVILDENLKPWVLEVNISPSLHSDSSLDVNVKGEMIKDLFNIAGFRLPHRSSSGHDEDKKSLRGLCMDKRILPGQCSSDERAKHAFYVQHHKEDHIMASMLNVLTPDDVRVLVETVDEESRCGSYELVFPTASSHKYLEFMDQPRYYNLLLDAWLRKYHTFSSTDGCSLLENLTAEGLHLQNPTDNPKHQWSASAAMALSSSHSTAAAPARVRTGRANARQLSLLTSKSSATVISGGEK